MTPTPMLLRNGAGGRESMSMCVLSRVFSYYFDLCLGLLANVAFHLQSNKLASAGLQNKTCSLSHCHYWTTNWLLELLGWPKSLFRFFSLRTL